MLSKELTKQLYQIASEYDIEAITLFGSRAHGDHHKTSDIDLAVHAPNIKKKEWLDFVFRVEEELETLLQIDIVRFEEASEKLKDEIRKGTILYKKNEMS